MENECVGCGCSETKACTKDSEACHWLVKDDALGLGVCSYCPEHVEAFKQHQNEMADLAK
jgi:hypothetical protein